MHIRGILKLTKEQKNKFKNKSVNYINFDKSTMIKKVTWTIVVRFCVMFIIVFGVIQIPYLENIPGILKMFFLVFYLICFMIYTPYFSVMNSFDSSYIYYIFEKRVYKQKKRTKIIFDILVNKYLTLKGECSAHVYNLGRVLANYLMIIIDIFLLTFENQFQWSCQVSFFFYLIVSFFVCVTVFSILNCIEWFAGCSLSFSNSRKLYWCFILLFFFFDIWITITDKQGLICLFYELIDWTNFSPDFCKLINLFDTFLQNIGICVITLIYSRIKNYSEKNLYKNLVNFVTIWIIMFSFYKYEIIVQFIVSSIAQFYIGLDNTSKKVCNNEN